MSLRVDNLVKQYARRRVVDDVSFVVEPGEIVGLLGPNGAGKTTTFYSIVGFVRPNGGAIILDGDDITNQAMHLRARRGIGFLPQETSIFRGLSVADNILVVMQARGGSESQNRERLTELLEELQLTAQAQQRADTLSGGETRRVEIARALATEPQYILLDEPFTGIDPRTVEDIQAIMARLREKGLSILITDHNVRETLRITNRAYIMVDGRILASGSARELTSHEQVRRHYLGERFEMDWLEL